MARCNESPPETDLKLSRLDRVQRLKDIVDEVARRDVICRSAVNTLLRSTGAGDDANGEAMTGIHRVHNAPPES